MRKILDFLATDGAFLYEDYDCRIIDSRYTESFGGTGSVTLRAKDIELRLWLDRDRLFMDVRGHGQRRQESWFSIDIVKELITGELAECAIMNAENTVFLKHHFQELTHLFSMANLSQTESTCRKLEKQRSKRMFD